MTTDRLGTALHDLVDRVEDDALAPEPADLWRDGTRRRTRTRVAAGLAAAAVVSLVTLVAWPAGEPRASLPATSRDASGHARLTSHPDAVAKPPFARSTSRPGVSAAVARELGDEIELHAVSPRGVVTRFDLGPASATQPDVALSADGRWLAVGAELYDLVDGATQPSAEEREALSESRVPAEDAAWWTPDSTRAFVAAPNQGTPSSDGLVLGTDGSVVEAPLVAGGRVPMFAGWLDDDTMLAFVDLSDAPKTTSGRLEGRTWTVGDAAWGVAPVDLEWTDVGEAALSESGQREVTLTADATRLLLAFATTTGSGEDPTGTVAIEFDARTGRQLHRNEAGPGVIVSPTFASFEWHGWGCRPGSYRGESTSAGRGSSPTTLESFATPIELSSRYDDACLVLAGGEVRGDPVAVQWPWWQDRAAAWGPWVLGAAALAVLLFRYRGRRTWREDVEPPRPPIPHLPRG